MTVTLTKIEADVLGSTSNEIQTRSLIPASEYMLAGVVWEIKSKDKHFWKTYRIKCWWRSKLLCVQPQRVTLTRVTFNCSNPSAHKNTTPKWCGIFMSMGYKKDIFYLFAYEFALLQKMKSVLTQGWNQLKLMKSSALPQMKLNPSLSPDEVGFHHEVISSHESGISPVSKDGFRWKEPTLVVDKCGFFSGGVRGICLHFCW